MSTAVGLVLVQLSHSKGEELNKDNGFVNRVYQLPYVGVEEGVKVLSSRSWISFKTKTKKEAGDQWRQNGFWFVCLFFFLSKIKESRMKCLKYINQGPWVTWLLSLEILLPVSRPFFYAVVNLLKHFNRLRVRFKRWLLG